MKSLIYREWILMRKQLLLTVGGLFVVGLLMFLTRLSMRIGNLSRIESVEELNSMTYLMFAAFLPLFLFLLVRETSVHASDVQSGFLRFRYTLPVTELQFLGAKYIIRGAVFLLAWGLSLLWGVILNAGGVPEDAKVSLLSVISTVACLSVASTAITDPLTLLARDQRQLTVVNWLAPFIPMVILYGVAGGGMLYETRAWQTAHPELDAGEHADEMVQAIYEKYALLLDHVTLWMLIGSFVFLLVSFGLSYLALKRREK